ncbi:Response regulator receiver domain-containing protein [Desulfatibacillum alkenivorans DSM 16219]|uniref:Response regulator receiver domain-containing protein n=1 Tax=Desulfatibacillum alkenivorans DSM 16219 TaxID=1121393 RepID=A0A1M6ZIX7_9BACT|nr:response regulator [Desulfatibacillum alkenivorans]SHL30354.1 Response regulator receiver domain-containing protein [Desulfatibacillum alkenivorans DSM 16219]
MSRILIIDDDSQIRKMLRKMLATAGYAVAEARDGAQALEIQAREPADMIITDIIMPVKGGIDTIQEFTEKYPGVKIIAMSGGGFLEAEDHLTIPQRMGIVHTFAKPLEREKILTAVKDLLDQPSA